MLSTSLQYTPLAAVSRPVAGTRKNTLIVTLPGSVKAVKENLEALFNQGVINHALDLIKGGNGREVHAALAQSSGQQPQSSHDCHHHHHHDHGHQSSEPRNVLSHDPSAPGGFPIIYRFHNCKLISQVSTRNRQSPYTLVSFEDAIRLIQQNIKTLPTQTLPVCAYNLIAV